MKSPVEVRTQWNLSVPMRDGVTLATDLYLPRMDDPVPALLLRTPYGKHGDEMVRLARYFAANGYAVAVMDVRGRGDSEGTFIPYFGEGQDGYDSVEWLAKQPFCSGKVATMGASYLGRIQWLTALEKPPHLSAMVVAVTPSDPFVEWPTGVPVPAHAAWLFLTSGRTMQNTSAVQWDKVYEHLPLMTMDEATGRHMPMWREEFLHTQLDEYWKRLCYQTRFEEIDLPIMHITGWYDDEQVGTLRNFEGMTSKAATERARRSQRLVVGPWGHQVNKTQKLGEVDFGPQALIDLEGTELRFLDYFLKGEENGVAHEPPVSIFVMGMNQWRVEREWPPSRATYAKYFLHSGGRANSLFGDGTLNATRPLAEPSDSYTYDPVRPVPFIMDVSAEQISGPDDYTAIERRDDVLVYTSEVLTEAMEVTGPITAEIYAETDAADTDFMAKLIDVWPTGFAQRLSDGMVRARFRLGMDRADLIEPNQIYKYEVDCWYLSHVFLPGHRIRLEVASSAFPKYDRNPNTGDPLGQYTRVQVAHQTIHHDQEHPSSIILPIIQR